MARGLILGIESSCDETAAAVVERGARTLSSVVASQIATHARYGGGGAGRAGAAQLRAAVVERGARTLSSVVASQIATHARYGGVVPELASREHLRAIVPVVRAALDRK